MYDKDEDLQFYEKFFDVENQNPTLNDKKLVCEGMLEVDPDVWIPIQCVMIPIRETELAYHCTITVYQVDDDKINELFGGDKVSWIPKSKIDSCYWICVNVFEHTLKVSNRRF